MRFKFVTAGQQLEQVPVYEKIIHGNSLKPLAPTHIKGQRNTAGDLFISWIRRDRIALPLRDFAGTPLSEQSERYLLEVYNGLTLVRSQQVEASNSSVVWI